MNATPSASPERIAFVVTRADTIGGSSVHIRDIASRLRDEGRTVVVMGGGEGVFADEIRRQGLAYVSIPNFVRNVDPVSDLRALARLQRELRAFRPDLVSLHTAKAGWLGRVAGRSLGVPVSYTPHGWPFADGVPRAAAHAYAVAERTMAPWTTRFVNVCADDRRTALGRRVGRPQQHVVIHNGVKDVDTALRADTRVAPPRMLMVARFERQKDHATLIEALRPLLDLPWSLELVGSGDGRRDVEQRIRRAGLDERIEILGRRDDVAERMAAAQVFLLCTHWEGFPRSILEAMRAGLPVLATNVAGVPEAVEEGVTGFLIPRQDAPTWTARLRTVVDDADLRARLGTEGRSRYEARFTFDAMYAATVRLYEEVVGAHGRGT